MAICVFGGSGWGSTCFLESRDDLASHWVETIPELLPRGQWYQLSSGVGMLSVFCMCSHSVGVTYLHVRVGSVHAAGSELPLSHSSTTASSGVGCGAHLSFLLLRSCWLGKLSSLPWWDPQLQSVLVCSGCLRIFTDDLCLCNKYSNHDMFMFWA